MTPETTYDYLEDLFGTGGQLTPRRRASFAVKCAPRPNPSTRERAGSRFGGGSD